MQADEQGGRSSLQVGRPWHRRRWLLPVPLALYAALAYCLMPLWWRLHIARHPGLQHAPRVTHTAAGIPGDPLNVALIAAPSALVKAMLAAGWHPADPITFEPSQHMAGSAVFHRPYLDAPVSSLYLWGRRQDLAFEQPVGDDPRRRHHVRLWRAAAADAQGRPLWMGAATDDTSVGFSHTTGQITHHIAADIDAERDKLMGDLQRAGQLRQVFWLAGFHRTLAGRNGGGDAYYTDGRLAIGLIDPP
jgi:hypothetical protein